MRVESSARGATGIEQTQVGCPRERVDGSIDFGCNFTKATDITQLSFNTGFAYRDRIREWNVDLTTIQSDSVGSDSSESSTPRGEQRRFFGHRWYWSGPLQRNRSDEVGLDLRTLIGGEPGRYRVPTNARRLTAFDAVGLSRERCDNADNRGSIELIVGRGYDAFRFDAPELDVSATFVLLPSLTKSGRVRNQAELSFRYELIDDLYAEIAFSEAFDSNPQSVDAEKSGYAITTSVGYSFLLLNRLSPDRRRNFRRFLRWLVIPSPQSS